MTKNYEESLRLEEYKMIQDTLNRESSLFWTRFNILLAVEIFLFSAFAFLIKELYGTDESESIISNIDSWIIYTVIVFFIILGVGTTFIWFTITEKSSGLIRYFADRMRVLEVTLKPIDKQTLLEDIFYDSSNIDSKDKQGRFTYLMNFKDNLRWSQKKSITGSIRILIIGIFTMWISMIPMIVHVITSKWKITGPLLSLPIIIILLFVITSTTKANRLKRKQRRKDIIKKVRRRKSKP